MIVLTDDRNIKDIYIESWTVNELKLKGTELIIYSLLLGDLFNKDLKVKTNLKYLSASVNCTKEGVKQSLNKLKAKHLIAIEEAKCISDEDAFNILNKKNSEKGCLFCGLDEYGVIDNHHYPIRRKDGGIKTIALCPNCHRRFHLLTDSLNQDMIITILNENKVLQNKEKITRGNINER